MGKLTKILLSEHKTFFMHKTWYQVKKTFKNSYVAFICPADFFICNHAACSSPSTPATKVHNARNIFLSVIFHKSVHESYLILEKNRCFFHYNKSNNSLRGGGVDNQRFTFLAVIFIKNAHENRVVLTKFDNLFLNDHYIPLPGGKRRGPKVRFWKAQFKFVPFNHWASTDI